MLLIGVARDVVTIIVKAIAYPEIDVSGFGENVAISKAAVNSVENKHRVLMRRALLQRTFFGTINGHARWPPGPAKSCVHGHYTIDAIRANDQFSRKLFSRRRNQIDAVAANFAANDCDPFAYLGSTLPAFLQQRGIEVEASHHGIERLR